MGGPRGLVRADAGRAAQPDYPRVRRGGVRQEVEHREPPPRRRGREGEPSQQRAERGEDELAFARTTARRCAVPAGRLLRGHHHLHEHEAAGVVRVKGEPAGGGRRRQRERPGQAHQFRAARHGPGPREQSRRQRRSAGQAEASGHVDGPRRRVRRSATAVACRNVRIVHRLPLQQRRLPRRDEAGVRIGQVIVGGRGQGDRLRLRAGEAESVLHGRRAAGPRGELQRRGVLEPAVPGDGLQLRRHGAGQPRAGQVPVRTRERAAHGQPVLRARRVGRGRPGKRIPGRPRFRRQRRPLLHGPRGLRVDGGVADEQEQEGGRRRAGRRPGGRVRPLRDLVARLRRPETDRWLDCQTGISCSNGEWSRADSDSCLGVRALAAGQFGRCCCNSPNTK